MGERDKGVHLFRELPRTAKRKILKRYGFNGGVYTPEKWKERFEAFIRDCEPDTYTSVITNLLRLSES